MDHTKNVISFCTGYGGIEMGIERTGQSLRTLAACEIETYAIKAMVEKMESGALQSFPIWSNLKTFDGRPFRDKVDILCAGYPCQPFSHAGKRKGDKDPRHLWPFIKDHVATIRPIRCFFENVSGHLTLGFSEVTADLRGMGYFVEAGIFSASETGAPHQRKRLFILAYSDSHTSGPIARGNEETSSVSGEHRTEICGGDVARTSSELADTMREGLERDKLTGGVNVEIGSRPNGTITECGGVHTYHVARPGEPQHDWEEPRTIKSGVGRAINGSPEKLDSNRNRVDRLRLLGNAVYPDTAALAWVNLNKKMDDNFNQ